MKKVIIIGGGLSGLTCAYLLKKKSIEFQILEAQSTLGGRVHTVKGQSGVTMEMGATWFSLLHNNLVDLLHELDIGYFEQYSEGKSLFHTKSFEPPQTFYVPANETPSYRIKGGTSSMINALLLQVGEENILLNTHISEIKDEGDLITIIDNNGIAYEASQVISTISPKILRHTVAIHPPLPLEVNALMNQVQTWMEGSVKFAVEYEKAFWLDNGFSGMVFSQTGLIAELYDHSSYDQSKFALMGFLNGNATRYNQEQRKEIVLQQISNLYGEFATEPISYHDKLWDHKYISTSDNDFLAPHQNNGHPYLHQPYLGGKFFLAGTETISRYPGYLDAAIASAHRVVSSII